MVEPLATDGAQRSVGGVYVPNYVQNTAFDTVCARVVAVGEGDIKASGKPEPPDIKVGDIIWHLSKVGINVKHNGRLYRVLAEKDVIAVKRS